ncbi:hypothetical protein ABW19_dt0205106 [Dactylella cylindrospora]|nr:hypothetical protein ABW19_dt0205106 [Dactylella cylindrospora]
MEDNNTAADSPKAGPSQPRKIQPLKVKTQKVKTSKAKPPQVKKENKEPPKTIVIPDLDVIAQTMYSMLTFDMVMHVTGNKPATISNITKTPSSLAATSSGRQGQSSSASIATFAQKKIKGEQKGCGDATRSTLKPAPRQGRRSKSSGIRIGGFKIGVESSFIGMGEIISATLISWTDWKSS